MKAIVLGSNGFVGKKLVERLLMGSDWDIYTPTSCQVDLRNQYDTHEFFKYVPKDSVVFFLAAKVGGIKANMADPYHFLFDNLSIQNNVVNACLNRGIERMIFLGSSCIYPKDYPEQPLKEEYLLRGIPEPTNEGYALAKIAGLKLIQYANKQFGMNYISLMPSNLYGPGDCFDSIKSHVLSATIKKVVDAKRNNEPIKIWGTGKPRREFLYVDDLVDCMLWSVKNISKTETFLNVGSGEDISVLELTNKVCDIVDYHPEFIFDTTQPDGMMRKLMDSSKINNLGWKPKTSIDEGIKKTIEYYINTYVKDRE